jgi:hypothetical protein
MISIVQEYGERKTRWTLEITSGQIPPPAGNPETSE